jgi:hypothetical protein
MTATVHGQVPVRAGRDITHRVILVEETQIGFRLAGASPFQVTLPRSRVVGSTETDSDGRFRIEYTPSEVPPDSTDWKESLWVEVYDGPTLVWTSTAHAPGPVVEIRSDDPDVAGAVLTECTVHGLLTACGRPAAGCNLVVTEEAWIGIQLPGKPCIPHLSSRVVARPVTDAQGAFRVTFRPTPDIGPCGSPSRVHISMIDGSTVLWQSPTRLVAPDIAINEEIYPDCPANASIVRVFDDQGVRVPGAEVYVDGVSRGTTGAVGELHISPPLARGQLVAARKLIHEQPSGRRNHADGGTTNWAYRVYQTSVRLGFDANGNGATLPLAPVDDPSRPLDLVVQRRNTMIGFNLVVSIEWDASSQETDRLHDRLVEVSELLFNATDGQFLVENFGVCENAGRWDDADIRIYADLNQPSNSPLAGMFAASGQIKMNPNDAYYAGITLHELGHYAFGVGDEYEGHGWDPANGPVRCTLHSTDTSSPFSSGGDKDSCFMRGAQAMNKKKLCSAHRDNPHVGGTAQGSLDCWSAVLAKFGDDRWRLQSPTTRGVIVGRLPGVPARRVTDPPPELGEDTLVPSFIPVAAWRPQVRWVRDHRGTLAESVVVRAQYDGKPVRQQKVWLHQQSNGRKFLQGQTKNAYVKAYGVSTGDGELPLRGAHVGDEVSVVGTAAGAVFQGKAVITSTEAQTLVVPLTRIVLPFSVQFEPRGVGTLGVKMLMNDAQPLTHRQPTVYVLADGAGSLPGYTRVRPAEKLSMIGGLPGHGITVAAVVATIEGEEVTDERGLAFFVVDYEPALLRSSDGRLKLRLQGGTLDQSNQMMVEAPGAFAVLAAPLEWVVSGPYRIALFPGEVWKHDAALSFRLPSVELPANDVEKWLASLVVVELDEQAGLWHRLPSTCHVDPALVSTRISRCGTYALVRSVD